MAKKEKEPLFAAYGFLSLVEPDASVTDAIASYAAMDGVTFAHAFVGGSFDGFVVAKSDAFEEIQSFILGPARRQGELIDWSILVAAALILKAPHKKFVEMEGKPHHESLIRISTEPRRASSVLAAIDALYAKKVTDDFGARAAIVTGANVDILVELASPSIETLQGSIVDDLANIKGITGSETSFAFVE
jgi:DNA-binding Lrp family transcriptional regulator